MQSKLKKKLLEHIKTYLKPKKRLPQYIWKRPVIRLAQKKRENIVWLSIIRIYNVYDILNA